MLGIKLSFHSCLPASPSVPPLARKWNGLRPPCTSAWLVMVTSDAFPNSETNGDDAGYVLIAVASRPIKLSSRDDPSFRYLTFGLASVFINLLVDLTQVLFIRR